MEDKLSTMQKALAINLDDNIYGTIAEIGAGQEVARFFPGWRSFRNYCKNYVRLRHDC